jgi:hypothetical protein
MAQMCLDLQQKYENRNVVKGAGTANSVVAKLNQRACSRCKQYGHRADNHGCPQHPQNIRQNTGASAVASSKLSAETQMPTGASALAISNLSAETEMPTGASAVPITRVFRADALISAFPETATEFAARLQASDLMIQRVPSSGECFWSAAFVGLLLICERNMLYANSIRLPESPLAMRNQVVDFIVQNFDTVWAEKNEYLASVSSFRLAVQYELPDGVCNGRTGKTDYPATVEEWVTLMRYQYAYTSLVCVMATALHFRVSVKVFIMGCATEAYVPRRELDQIESEMHVVHPDSTLCVCKNDRGEHFDACPYVSPSQFVPNRGTKTGRGKARQARYQSSTERKRRAKHNE